MSTDTTPEDIVTKDMLEQQFNEFGFKLFEYLDKRFDEVNRRIDGTDEKFDRLMTTLDAFLKRLDGIEKENQFREHEIERIKRWIEAIAQKTGVKLEY
ncbi:hypothetical protein EYC59_02980 [Candidatus Saccharibacteria bacterium]|nr:MAG: hypothetical protein EYC59_02980 [Candidatus Saccharibacteria bacterium]